MKKTFTINISGNVFHIEEDAFAKLQDYLHCLNHYFAQQKGGQEIISDIESRIAELFNNKINDKREAIIIEWVDEVMAKMGRLEDFMSPEENQAIDSKEYVIKKRLYRDTEHRVLGGVCSGLSAYLNIDPVLIRILFIVLIFLGVGISAVIYLVLWIVVPEAATTAQRLEMKGQEPTISNIQKTIQEEVKEVRNSFSRFNRSETFTKGKDVINKAGNAGANILRRIARIFSILIGAMLIFVGFISLVIFFISLALGNSIFEGGSGYYTSNLDLSSFLGFFVSPEITTISILLIVIIVGIPLITIFFVGTKMVFRYNTNNKLIGWGALGIWLVALISGILIMAGQANNFSAENTTTSVKSIDCQSCNTLFIELATDEENYQLGNNTHMDDFIITQLNGKQTLAGIPHLKIESTEGNDFIVSMKRKARGKNKSESLENLQHIQYEMNTQDSTLVLSPIFTLADNAKWRDQEVTIVVKVPNGKKIHLNKELDQLYLDFESLDNPSNYEMSGHTFKMTNDGLAMNN